MPQSAAIVRHSWIKTGTMNVETKPVNTAAFVVKVHLTCRRMVGVSDHSVKDGLLRVMVELGEGGGGGLA